MYRITNESYYSVRTKWKVKCIPNAWNQSFGSHDKNQRTNQNHQQTHPNLLVTFLIIEIGSTPSTKTDNWFIIRFCRLSALQIIIGELAYPRRNTTKIKTNNRFIIQTHQNECDFCFCDGFVEFWNEFKVQNITMKFPFWFFCRIN